MTGQSGDRDTRSVAVGVLLAAALLGLLAGCRGTAGREDEAAGLPPGSEVRRENDGSIEVVLRDEARERLALQEGFPKAAVLHAEREAFGRVLDPAQLIALAGEDRAASVEAVAAQAELARSKALVRQENASLRSLDAAKVAEARARADADSVHAKLLLGWGSDLATRPDLPGILSGLLAGKVVLVRVDFPSHEILAVRSARFSFADSPDAAIAGTVLGSAPDVDQGIQGQAFFVAVPSNGPGLKPGAFVLATLELAADDLPAVVVPRTAVVRTGRKAWIYLSGDDPARYRRVVVSLDRSTPDGWLVAHGIVAGQRIVLEGAQQLLSEEVRSSSRIRD